MDPWLERGDLWPDVHNRLIAALGDVLGPRLRPRYFVALEERVYVEEAQGLALVGRPDLAVIGARRVTGNDARSAAAVVEVELPIADRLRETYLEIRSASEGEVVTVLEVLSPANKRAGEGRRLYLQKRSTVLATLEPRIHAGEGRGHAELSGHLTPRAAGLPTTSRSPWTERPCLASAARLQAARQLLGPIERDLDGWMARAIVV